MNGSCAHFVEVSKLYLYQQAVLAHAIYVTERG